MDEAVAARFPGSAVAATLAIGSGVGCITALQPILLGALFQGGRIGAAQIGEAATAEAAGMAISITLVAMLVRPERLRGRAALVLLAMALVNLATARAEGGVVLALRVLNGAGTGYLFWILTALIARAAVPARLFALYVTVQSTGSLTLSLLLTQWIVPHFGPAGGYGLIAAIDLALLAATTAIPRGFAAIGDGSKGLPPPRGLVALASIALLLAGILGFWVYAVPLLHALGYADATVRAVLPIGIGCQIVGGLLAAVLAARLRAVAVCAGGAVAVVGAMLTILASHDVAVLVAGLGLFAICWMAIPPFQMPLLIGADPSLRSASLIGTAQLTGLTLGPVFAAAFVTPYGVCAAAWAGIGLIVASLVLLFLAVARSPARAAIQPEPLS